MNSSETAALCRFTKAACPQQAIDEYTPDAWSLLLADVSFDDGKAAVLAIAKRQPFVAPAEIRAEVNRIRAKRLDAAGPLTPPDTITDRDYPRWLYDTRQAIADGRLVITPALDPVGPQDPQRRPLRAPEPVSQVIQRIAARQTKTPG